MSPSVYGLKDILEANDLDSVELDPPNFGTFDPEESREARYPLC